MSDYFQIWNMDCIAGARTYLAEESVDLIICDPPFGLRETTFDNLYKRNKDTVIEGYVEAPKDYYNFTKEWMSEAKRILKPDGTLYVIIGHTPLRHVLNAADELNLQTINHIIWKFNFGTNATRHFVTSHYSILYLTKQKAKPTFNVHCRFGPQERDTKGSLLYQDLEDVFVINKEYAPKQIKNINKLPNALIEKLILYSSNPEDVVCDFFLGNFTTAYVSLGLGRRVVGFELNESAYNHHNPKLQELQFGQKLPLLKNVEIITPHNQGKPITEEEKESIKKDYFELLEQGKRKKDISAFLCEKYGRGPFGIKNILDSILKHDIIDASKDLST
jgi:site-specific DNA-methyltransferase (adenine-specific)